MAALTDAGGDSSAGDVHVFVFPDDFEVPASFAEPTGSIFIAALVALDFVGPVSNVAARSAVVLRATVPETSAYLDSNTGGPEYHVGGPAEIGQGPGADTVSKA